ncbi:hypothetical protein ACRALDRAFT_2042070 [Sodiomyces alcalophilus JCM 7366]|uniref:uncharacterized protein n=1 Tax=Sodiomyces alcalophilus JCM 7366 TaxID=591952 RepID=UPI0039B40B78
MAAATHQDGSTSPTKLQRILDLEHKLKMERLQASPVSSRLSLPVRGQDTASRHESLTARPAHRSTPNVANLTILIPPSTATASPIETPQEPEQSQPRPESPVRHSQKTDNLVGSGDEENSDSDSSICQSPSWEGYGQRRKEKKAETKQRRKKKQEQKEQKEQTDAHTKHTTKNTKKSAPAAKLTKPPPLANRPDNSKADDRDPDTGRPRRTNTQADHYPPSASRVHHKRRRSSSVASQIRAVFTGQRTKEKQVEKEKEKKKGKEVGFIGGLKLEKEREAARKAAEAANAPEEDTSHLKSRDSPQSSPPQPSQSNTPDAVPSAQTSRLSRGAPPVSISRITSPKIKASSFPISLAAQSTVPATGTQDGHAENNHPSSTDESHRGRQSGSSYVQQQRQQSRDRAIVGFRDETLVSGRSHYPPQARRPQYARSHSLNSEPNGQGSATDTTPNQRADTSAGSSSSPSLKDHGNGSNNAQSGSSQGFAPRSSRSPSTGPVTTKGFRNSMQAALYKFKPTADRPSPSHSNSDVDRQSSNSISTFNLTAASASSDRDTSQSSSGSPQLAGGKSDITRTVKAQDAARPSSSSSSCGDESFRDSSIMTTPDSFRPQSDDHLPPVSGELRKGPLGTHPRHDWDGKVFRPSQQVAGPTPTPMSPRSVLAPIHLNNGGNVRVMREGGYNKAEPFVQRGQKKATVVKRSREPGSDAYRTYLLPMEVTASKADLVPPPLDVNPISSPKEGSRVAGDARATLSMPKPMNGRTTTLQRILSLPKSRSPTSVKTATNPSSRESKGTPVPAPPPRARARRTSWSRTRTSSVSLPDALPSNSVPAGTNSPPSPDISSATSDPAPRDVAASTSIPLQASRLASSGKEGASDPLAKILVECCHCRFFHDMPSRVYECMVRPQAEVADPELGVSGAITTMVNCPWCKHGMTTQCCAGYAAVVHLKERLH